MQTQAPPPLVAYFSANPVSLDFSIEIALREAPEAVRSMVEAALRYLPSQAVEEAVAIISSDGAYRHQTPPELLFRARLYILRQQLTEAILALRIEALRSSRRDVRPAPYAHPAIGALPIDADGLVNVTHFDSALTVGPDVGRFLKSGFEFHMVPVCPELHSSYWLKLALLKVAREHSVAVRLDPLLIQPENGIRAGEFRMIYYGRPAFLDELEDAAREYHWRWLPDRPDSSDVAFTDAVWSPRNGELHLTCEEVPKLERCATRPSRYLHAVFTMDLSNVKHLDGALRIYTPDEVQERIHEHVRKAGKVGTRVKVFRINDIIGLEEFASIAGSFFVWNDDCRKYFCALPTRGV